MGEPVTSHRPWWREWSAADWTVAVVLVLAGFVLHALLTPWLWRVIVLGVFVAYPGRVWWRRRNERRRVPTQPPKERYTPPPPSGTT